jgi:multidrug efflux pump
VVALTIPLGARRDFSRDAGFGIDLHRISTGALIIALGLLVDDAMIAVEMMHSKLEEGSDKLHAATYAYYDHGLPMLSGTLITGRRLPADRHLPSRPTGEYTFAIFAGHHPARDTVLVSPRSPPHPSSAPTC